MMKIKYNGVTTNVSDNLFDKPIIEIDAPIKTKKFDTESLYFKGKYYFYKGIKPNNTIKGYNYEIQVVFYNGKWKQDTVYITKEFKEFLLNNIK